jgi:serine/threonine-protein kinase HipA
MGETSDTKYQRDYGSMIESLAKFVGSAEEEALRRNVVKAVVINHMIGNGDAHLKNFGVLYNDVHDVALSPFFDCVSTLPYIPDDIPALALSFDWYSKAWWPRTRIEEFARTHGTLGDRQISALIDEAAAGVAHGVEVARRHAREIPGFQQLGGDIARLWNDRVTAFTAEASGLRKRRASR